MSQPQGPRPLVEPRSTGDRRLDALARVLAIVDRLRASDGCPWDREQTVASLAPSLVEEAHEAVEAIDRASDRHTAAELGDLFMVIALISKVAEQENRFDLATVASAVVEKLVRRHPHIFGEDPDLLSSLPTEARTASEVRENWDAIKRGETGGRDPFASMPENLPSLLYAAKLQRRGGEPASAREALSEITRALEEAARGATAQESDREQLYGRIGDLLFACVKLARAVGADPEIALRRSAEGFRARAGSAA